MMLVLKLRRYGLKNQGAIVGIFGYGKQVSKTVFNSEAYGFFKLSCAVSYSLKWACYYSNKRYIVHYKIIMKDDTRKSTY